MDYVLITAAKNEEQYIERTMKSVLEQTVLPKRWVIVSDGSTDRTDQIIEKYAADHEFVKFVRRELTNDIGFASKVHALNLGYAALADLDYHLIGHLDADVTFEREYYEKMLIIFHQNPMLGLGGGFIYERHNGEYQSRPFNSRRSVAGAIQLFRRDCYEAIGGFIPLKAGGEDWYAEVMTKMKGWRVEAFPELKVFHHKMSKAARGVLRDSLRQGIMDYSLGSHPIFEFGKCVCRIKERPFFLVAFFRLSGFFWCYLRGENKPVPIQFVEYLRAEQLDKMRRSILNMRKLA